MDRRLSQLTDWVRAHAGLADAEPEPVAGDASFRRYFRVRDTDGQSRIVMDAPPGKESTSEFLAVARHWRAEGVRVPAIIDADEPQGLILLEDFGDRLLLDELTPDNADRHYSDALNSLCAIQQTTEPAGYPLPPYDEALLDREMNLFRDWLLTEHLGLALTDQDHCLLDTTFNFLRESALAQPQAPVHRDYHSRNLLITDAPDDPGIIDFQDAVMGPVTYDLVSLAKDCYIAWPEERVSGWIEQFRQQSRDAGLHAADADTFRQWAELMGMQRHLKASGIFARLYRRDGKDRYLADIPRTVNYLRQASERQPALRHFHDWLTDRVIPALTGESDPS
ncbi:aminoglycoside phosphotransferase [Tamilnaduibacter salinus]|uniref:Aminoglycoside phosphotransferase n=1 Tax=Tamilnaduibacter salinus TaxID=1484056 RepID=A0A2A2I3P1_9GAMM|nr:phosphotransferase [Tamilnaduibacter salinus]PAV25745.1 aminoglycoside phosphotransferase [Tamilnaduibacter salinus]